MTPPPSFFNGGGVKKKLKVGQIQKSFQTKFIFVGGGVKKDKKKARAAVQNARVLWLGQIQKSPW